MYGIYKNVLQKEVDNILQNVATLDLGDDRSTKDLQNKMNKYKQENRQLTH